MSYGSVVQGAEGAAFKPAEPSLDDLLERIKPENVKPLEKSPLQEKNEALLKAYVRVFGSDDARLVLESLLDMSMRTTLRPISGFKTIEETAMAAVEHQAKCDFVSTILASIVMGQNLNKQAKTKEKS